MSLPGKDAFLQPAPKAVVEDGEGTKEERTTKEWARRLIVDGVEVDPVTMQPLSTTEE
jgi:hypothetical protein